MKLSKKLIAEIENFLADYWETYFSGDLEKWSNYLPEDYRNIGTTNEEVWNSRQELLDYTYSVFDQMIGMAELRNKTVEIIPYNGYFMAHELGDLYLKSEKGWNFYAPIRLSSLLEKNKGKWQVLHQHGSYPDSRTQEGEAFAFDALKAENKKLQAAVTKRTKELELKNRELAIEASLERVRAQTSAMEDSSQLAEVIKVVFQEAISLGFGAQACDLIIFDRASNAHQIWISGELDENGPVLYGKFKNFNHEHHQKTLEAWKRRRKLRRTLLKGKTSHAYMKKFTAGLKEHNFPQEVLDFLCSIKSVHHTDAFMKFGLFRVASVEPLMKDEEVLLKRFTKVFEQTYTRFLDLKKAEDQAKEAQIEVALERVRTASITMQKGKDLAKVINVVFNQLIVLGFESEACGLNLYDEQYGMHMWMSGFGDDIYPKSFYINYFDHPYYKRQLDVWKSGTAYDVLVFEGKLKRLYDDQTFSNPDFFKLPKEIKKAFLSKEKTVSCAAYMRYGMLEIIGDEEISESQSLVLCRFAKVFQQAYTRFLDLQKAEAQAREAKIEAALERIRAKSMAMHKSEELAELSLELVKQVQILGEATWFCAFNIYDDDPQGSLEWGSNGEGTFPQYRTPREGVFLKYYKAGQQGESLLINEIGPKDCPAHYKYLCTLPGVGDQLLEMKAAGIPFPTQQVDHVAYFKYGYLLFITYKPAPELHGIFQRFAKVFEQSYARFLDLQKSEAQAREAQIEAALEKVRSRSMAMHTSDELVEASDVMISELNKLKINTLRVGICTIDAKSGSAKIWSRSEVKGKVENRILGIVPKGTHPVFDNMVKAWKSGKPYYQSTRKGKQVKDYYDRISKYLSYPKRKKLNNIETISAFFFKEGSINVVSLDPLLKEECDILIRFAAVFNQTYTRFLDLQKAEKQAREAQIEAALERVRAKALAMQDPEELKQVAEVLRKEMGALGIEELETSSVFINDEATPYTECWFAIKDIRSANKKLINDNFNLDLKDTWVGRKMLKFYTSQEKRTSIIMSGKNRLEWINYCEQRSTLLKGYYGKDIPDRTYQLYRFSHGAIGAATQGPISEDSWELLRRTSSVFSLAYARFKDLTQARNDLKLLKEEKQRAEQALTELKATQSQLIHSEKMASLGELTAGIAHEIQNPLNFVNNFSEVNIELIEELVAELLNGDYEEAKAIAQDIMENDTKIMHHGKRAEGIVKGMLQHSRTSSGEKELTDINLLADEYLRLSYHGLRAKDKSFNADFELDLDKSLPKVNVVPQDIGRVLLNLINNAFYAVRKVEQPLVKVSTKAFPLEEGEFNGIEIRVTDNGPGIHDDIKDKIFQPFFTTKATGEGTGLGLSLSYDIVTKGHDGELKVDTSVGTGTSFTMILPLKEVR